MTIELRHLRYWGLIQRFHAMQYCPNLRKEDGAQAWLEAMWVWMQDTRDPHMDEGVKWTCVFLLNVWAPGTPRDTKPTRGFSVPWPPFELFSAMNAWDDSHKATFTLWCRNPICL